MSVSFDDLVGGEFILVEANNLSIKQTKIKNIVL
jgi:hypothetical protein